MTEYEILAEALCRFLGRTDITPEWLQSFDSLSFEDTASDFWIKIFMNFDKGEYCIQISEYFDGTDLMHEYSTSELEEIEDYMGIIAVELNRTKDGLDRLLKLSSILEAHGEELGLRVSFNYNSSYYIVFAGSEAKNTRRSYEAADILDDYINEGMSKWIDLMNTKLAVYKALPIEYGENYEFYHEGIFLSIFYTGIGKATITFHASAKPSNWIQTRCESRRKINQTLSEIYRRIH